MILTSLLYIRGMWPMLVIAVLWIIPLLIIPKWVAPCSAAMDQITTQVTLDLMERGPRRTKQ